MVTVHSEVGVSVQMFKRLPMSLSPTMSKLDDASTASVAALDAADSKYDDADDDDDRKLSPLASGGMMVESGDDNIVPAQRANATFASPSSVEGDEDASPAASASSSSTGGESSRRGRGSTISTVASASTTIGGSGGEAGGGNAAVLIQHIDTHMSLPRSGGSGTVGEANGATVPPSMMDRVKKQLRKATFVTPATPTGETRRLAHKAFTGLIKKDEVYCRKRNMTMMKKVIASLMPKEIHPVIVASMTERRVRDAPSLHLHLTRTCQTSQSRVSVNPKHRLNQIS